MAEVITEVSNPEFAVARDSLLDPSTMKYRIPSNNIRGFLGGDN